MTFVIFKMTKVTFPNDKSDFSRLSLPPTEKALTFHGKMTYVILKMTYVIYKSDVRHFPKSSRTFLQKSKDFSSKVPELFSV